MKKHAFFATLTFVVGSLVTVNAAPKDEVLGAAKKLGDSANYSWTTTVKVPEGSQFRPGPSEGKIDKKGTIWLKMSFRDTTTEAVMQGEKGAVKTGDTDWRSLEELNSSEGRNRFLGVMLHNFKSPAQQAEDVVAGTKDLTKADGVYSGELTEDGAKTLLTFRGGRNGAAPTASDAKGTAKFWVKDGVLTKTEFEVSGKVSFNGNERDVERTTTVEIKDVGTTKIEIPADAQKKLEAAPAKAETDTKASPAPEKK